MISSPEVWLSTHNTEHLCSRQNLFKRESIKYAERQPNLRLSWIIRAWLWARMEYMLQVLILLVVSILMIVLLATLCFSLITYPNISIMCTYLMFLTCIYCFMHFMSLSITMVQWNYLFTITYMSVKMNILQKKMQMYLLTSWNVKKNW